MTSTSEIYDFIGVGIGPANMSLAALSQPLASVSARFYDRQRSFAWHPGLLFPESFIQTSYLKDLVTPVDPTNPYSFLAFLVRHRRFYAFLTAAFPRVSRAEFSQYLAWVSRSLPSLRFDCSVDSIDLEDGAWQVTTREGVARARDIVLGTGLRPYVPEFARRFVGPTLHHAIHVGHHAPVTAGRRVAVIGGGQSGAELVHHLLRDDEAMPSRLLWVSRREGFPPLDDSPFANELFMPAYSAHFQAQEAHERRRLLASQTLASDGVSMSLLHDIYRRLYALQLVEGRRVVRLLPGHDLVGLSRNGAGWDIEVRARGGHLSVATVDLVLLATGHRYEVPACLDPIRGRLHCDGEQLHVRDDFSVVWDGPSERRIFLQNGARHQRGVADPNLSLLAWRSAVILNHLLGRTVYECDTEASILDWSPQRVNADARMSATSARMLAIA
ncbi:lysine N(6)-hydroxylase/L-ornithine N(5)-oxygenase family protein [Haliangium sp.]|uniref:lysine N(6)-hydroxylase/L-ornithine N(5)-oxygenase family protein n=1 Tax=Haliangium sp. TaxID=2663208 RepID=UPI003D0BE019